MPGDLDWLIRIENAAFASDRIKRSSFRRLLESRTASILVYGNRESCAGYAVVLTRAKCRHARLYSLAVNPLYAGQGVGTKLLRGSERLARSKKARAMRLEVRTDNAAAVALYKAHSYVEVGMLPNYYADGSDAYRLSKPLDVH